MAVPPEPSEKFSFDEELFGSASTTPASPPAVVPPVRGQARQARQRRTGIDRPTAEPTATMFGSMVVGPATRGLRKHAWLAPVVLAATVTAALVMGLSAYQALISPIDARFVRTFSEWMTGVVIGSCIALICVAGAIVAVVVARPRVLAVVSLVAALTLPAIGLLLGMKFGSDVFVDAFGRYVLSLGQSADEAVRTLSGDNESLSSVLILLLKLFGLE